MTIKRTLADSAVAILNSCARIPGRRFYKLYLDDINRRFNDVSEMVVPVQAQDIRFACPNQLTQWRATTLLTKEPATISWIDSFPAGAVLWDVGANVGIYSLYAAITRNVRVLAFEPAPANYALLCRNIAINKLGDKISPFALALNDGRGLGTLGLNTMDAGGAFSNFNITGDSTGHTKLACIGYSIDEFIDDFAPDFPTHIKIDVDGIEETIIAGANTTLADKRLVSLSVELDDRQPQQIDRVTSSLKNHGFRLTGNHRSPFFADSPAQNYHFAR